MSISINLLPIERKKSIRIDIFNRFLLKMGIIVVFAIFLFIIFLLANLFIISIYQKINQQEINRVESGSLDGISKEAKDKIDNNYSETTKSIKEINQRTSYWDYLNQINQLLPENVYYTEIIIEKETIKLKGLAKKRDDLVKFKESLSKVEIFQEIEMPISNFTSQTDVNFEIVLKLNKK